MPWSILRLTQFHSFVAHIIKRGARAPFLILLPKAFRFQNLDLSDAAGRARCVRSRTGRAGACPTTAGQRC